MYCLRIRDFRCRQAVQDNSIRSVPVVHHFQQEDTLRRFREIKEVSPPKEKFWTYEEAGKTLHYNSTTRRHDEGRFVVEMLFVKPTSIVCVTLKPTFSDLSSN